MREYATLVPLVLLAFWIGIYPKPLFRVLDVPVRQIVEQVNPGYYNSATAQRWGEKPPVAVTKQAPRVSTGERTTDQAEEKKRADSAPIAMTAVSPAATAANSAERR